MNAQTKRRLDWFSLALLAAAVFCLFMSIPQSYVAGALTHSPVEAGLWVVVVELMAFFSLLSTRWLPCWESTLNWIAYALLATTTIANYAGGSDYFWAADLTTSPFWAGVRAFTFWDAPLGAIAVVGISAATIPAGVLLFLTLWVMRQRELEELHTPEAAAARAMEPVTVELEKMRRLQLIIASLQPDLAPQVVYPMPQEAVQMAFKPLEKVEPMGKPDYEPITEPMPAPAQPITEPMPTGLDAVLANAGLTRGEARKMLSDYGIRSARAAFSGLSMLGKLPKGLTFIEFEPMYAELTGPVAPPQSQPITEGLQSNQWACAGCGTIGSNGSKGPAKRYANKHNQDHLLCSDCRTK